MATNTTELFSLELSSPDWWDIYNALIYHNNTYLASIIEGFMAKEGM